MSTFEEDRADVLDSPEWTAEMFAQAKPFAEVFPDLARKMRGAQKEPKKIATSIRFGSIMTFVLLTVACAVMIGRKRAK